MGSLVRRSVGLALVAVLLTAGVALADGGNAGVTVTPFKTVGTCGTPTSPAWGLRIVKTGPQGFVKDVEQCLVPAHTLGLEPGTKYSIFDDPIGGWFSDYDFVNTKPADPVCNTDLSPILGGCIHLAVSGTLVVTKGPRGSYIWNVITNY